MTILDREKAFDACRVSGDALMECSNELKDDMDLVCLAVTTSVDTLLWASPRLRENKDVLLIACSHFGRALRYTESLRRDRDVVLAALKADGNALQMCGFRNDLEMVKVAIRHEPFALQYASEELRQNVELLVIAGRQNRKALKCAGSEKARLAAETYLYENQEG
jgi:hypothetical protein